MIRQTFGLGQGHYNSKHWMNRWPLLHLNRNASGSVILVVCILLGALTPFTCESKVEESCPNPVLQKCTCEYKIPGVVSKVNCTNVGFRDLKPLLSIPPSVESIVFAGNNIPELWPNIMGNTTMSCRNMSMLTALDLSRNHIRIIHGKAFHCMKNLEILVLDDNEWEVNEYHHTRVFSSLANLKHLRLKNVFAKGYTHTHLKQHFIDSFVAEWGNANVLEEIHLEDNHLSFNHPDLFCGLKNLKRIYFSHNNISTPRFNYECMHKADLTEIHLNDNNITYFPPTFLESLSHMPSLTVVNILNNPFRCDCNFIASYKWLKNDGKSKFVVGKKNFTCTTPAEYENVLIMSDMTEEDLKQACINKTTQRDQVRQRKIKTSYIILGIIFAILGVLFLAVLYLNRMKIKKKLHIHIIEPIRESMLGKNMHYGYASVSV